MKSVLLLALFAALIKGHNCDKANDKDKFIRICRAESESRRAFDGHPGNEDDKDTLFWEFLKARRERVALAKILGDIECGTEERVDDKQVFQQLCLDEMALNLYADNHEEFMKSKIDKMLRSAGWRRRKFGDQLLFETRETLACSASSSDTKSSKYTDLGMRLKEKFLEHCKEEAFYDYIKRKIDEASKGIKLELTQIPSTEARHHFEEAREAREQFCEGSIETCCDQRQVEQARADASLRAAEILLEMVEGSARLLRLMYEQEKRDNLWEARFTRACTIENQTSLGYSTLPVRPNVLAALHQLAVEVRAAIGKGLSDRTCSVEHPSSSESSPVQQDHKTDAACDFVKARVMCRAMNNANDLDQFNYNWPLFQQRRTSWCTLAKADARPKRSRCSSQMSAMLTDEALTEAQVLLELLKLDDGSWRLETLKKDMLNVTLEEHAALEWMRQLNEKELTEQTLEIRKEKNEQAYRLISDRLAQLGSIEANIV